MRVLILRVGSSFSLCETVVPLEDPIITETTSTLQEWGVLWKQLYVVSSSSTPAVGTKARKTTCILCGFCLYSPRGGWWGGDVKRIFLLPALPTRVANIWRYSLNVPRQLL